MRIGIDLGSGFIKTVILLEDGDTEVLEIIETNGQPILKVKGIFEQLHERFGNTKILCGVTGIHGESLKNIINSDMIFEARALTVAMSSRHPDVRTIIEIGNEVQRYMVYESELSNKELVFADSAKGGKCASGSGSFIVSMAKRLGYDEMQEFARVGYEAVPKTLCGRCAVFTESDITHVYQKGTPKVNIVAGLHEVIARNYRMAVASGKMFRDKVAFIGGVSENQAIGRYLKEELKLKELFVPKDNRILGAIGAAMETKVEIDLIGTIEALEIHLGQELDYESCEPIGLLSGESSTTQKSVVEFSQTEFDEAGLGVDIGSVSTKAALVTRIDGKFVVLASYYRRTDGDPLAAVKDTMANISLQIQEKGYRIGMIKAATTGSGRDLTGDYIGADLVRNEITAQASGALAYVVGDVTIFEIGGQDSKYLRLKNGVIVDFEMNKACAAGTGAFLEKTASIFGYSLEKLSEFGKLALLNKKPPLLDPTCTVLTQSALFSYQQANVPTEDLAAAVFMATVENFFTRNVGSRLVTEQVMFQGAVAKNIGMVAAFETKLGRKIIVPPNPHLTGAIGVARLAYLAKLSETKFRGFEQIADSVYSVDSFTCHACANYCEVNVFELNGQKYYYNDRCEKYSAKQKPNLGKYLPDLFGEREEMMMTSSNLKAPAGARKIGIPRGLMFSELYPLYREFWTQLGFEVVPSDPTDKTIISAGLDVAIGDPCFPFKAAHGHYVNLVAKGVEIIFAPGIHSTEQPNTNLKKSQTCPYLQAAPEVISAAVGLEEKGIKHISPKIHLNRSIRHLHRVFRESAQELGVVPSEANRALAAGLLVLQEFRTKVEKRGAEVLRDLKPDQRAFVVIGRPYTLWDPGINMNVGKKIQDLGILAIPQDYLPLEDVDISDKWPNAYSRQIQKKLAAARLIKWDSRLRAIVLTYFACGPDSFGNTFFKDEIGDEACYVMQLDEHTADAGVITRIEAFADTVAEVTTSNDKLIRSQEVSLASMMETGKKLWFPHTGSRTTDVLVAAMQAHGINAHTLPRSSDSGCGLARKAISEDVCLPCIMTTQDQLDRVNQPDFDPMNEAFFQGNAEGPCRYGMYSMLQRRILDDLGFSQVDVVTMGSKEKNTSLGRTFGLVTFDMLLCHDLLQRMLLKTRPYEINKGESDSIFDDYIDKLIKIAPAHKVRVEKSTLKAILGTSHLGKLKNLLMEAQKAFVSIPKRTEIRPLIGVVGEFYVRLEPDANKEVLRRLEAEGAETWLAPMTEFFSYANYINIPLSANRLKDNGLSIEELKTYLARRINNLAIKTDEHELFQATLPLLKGFEDINSEKVVKNGSRYLNPNFGGEAIVSMGKSVDFAERGLDGIVSVIPFNCMPGNVVTAQSQVLKKHYGNIPYLNLSFTGFVDSCLDESIRDFVWQVQERCKRSVI